MEVMHRLLNKGTELEDRILWFDGDSTVDPENLLRLIDSGQNVSGICVSRLTDDIKKYNSLVSKSEQITIKTGVKPLSLEWNIPSSYRKLNVIEYVGQQLTDELDHFSTDDEINARVSRVKSELKIFKKQNLFHVLQTIIYIINRLEEEQIVWGVGRGSSVSSYVLYLIGVHDVDSVQYELDFDDFIKQGA